MLNFHDKALYGLAIFSVINLLVLYLIHFLHEGPAAASASHGTGSAHSQPVGINSGQSPIDLPTDWTSVENDNYVSFSYGSAPGTVIHTGHAINVNWNGGSDGHLLINGQKYTPIQFHPHFPSEHTFNGKHYPFEVHIVHVGADGKDLAVLGFLFDIAHDDKRNAFLDAAYKDIATLKKTNDTYALASPLDATALTAQLKASKIYRYPGSLTTPPYTEGVEWNVIQNIQYMSRAQLEEYKAVMHHEPNNRETQPWAGRIPILLN